MELITFYRKVASRTGWWYVITNFRKMRFILIQIREASEKFSMMYQFNVWIQHTHLAVSISSLFVLALDYDNHKGHNYQIKLRKIFGDL